MTPGSEAVKKIVVEFLRRGEALTVEQLSNGEYQTINVVAALVMQSLTPCDFMLLDEPAIAIDYEHADRLYTLLQDTARREGRQFFIVDHGVLKDFPYDHKIEIVKENGVSMARWVEEQP
jgi:ABC-type cobalamin/Fe3+-siderophores transport system ATPase subunit